MEAAERFAQLAAFDGENLLKVRVDGMAENNHSVTLESAVGCVQELLAQEGHAVTRKSDGGLHVPLTKETSGTQSPTPPQDLPVLEETPGKLHSQSVIRN